MSVTDVPMARSAADELVDAHLRHVADGEIDAALAALADDVIVDVVNVPGDPMVGRDAARRGYEAFASVARCERFQTVRRLRGENLVLDEGVWQGRFVGALFGPARPDRTVRYRVLHVLELRSGRIVRVTIWHDLAAIQRQLTAEDRPPRRYRHRRPGSATR